MVRHEVPHRLPVVGGHEDHPTLPSTPWAGNESPTKGGRTFDWEWTGLVLEWTGLVLVGTSDPQGPRHRPGLESYPSGRVVEESENLGSIEVDPPSLSHRHTGR